MILQIKNDLLFHDLINKENIDIIEWIVMTILDLSYNEVHKNCRIDNIRLTRNNKKDRSKYVDLIIRYKDNIIIIELNNNFNGYSTRNIVFGMTEIVNHYSRDNESYYKDMIKVKLINLNWHKNKKKSVIKKRIDRVYSLEDLEKGLLYEIINVNLDKYALLKYNNIDTKEKLYKLLTIDNEEELNNFCKDERLLDFYKKKLIKLSKNEKYKEESMTELMERNIMLEESYTSGKIEGKEETQRNTVINMFERNFDLNTISDITKLSVSKIKKIIKSNNYELSK